MKLFNIAIISSYLLVCHAIQFQLKNEYTNKCLQAVQDGTNWVLDSNTCNNDDKAQKWEYTKQGNILVDIPGEGGKRCITGGEDNEEPILATCDDNSATENILVKICFNHPSGSMTCLQDWTNYGPEWDYEHETDRKQRFAAVKL